MNNGSPGAIAVPHESGWVQSELFVKWFEQFMRHADPIGDRRVLVIIDGHKAYTNNLPFIEIARNNNATVLCLPPRGSHRIQPIDVSSMKPLMTYLVMGNWMGNHRGREGSSTPPTFATMMTAVNGFRKNRHVAH